ncbi:hypothetical protein DSECCO2_317870 [anaerobic digester metagenome]
MSPDVRPGIHQTQHVLPSLHRPRHVAPLLPHPGQVDQRVLELRIDGVGLLEGSLRFQQLSHALEGQPAVVPATGLLGIAMNDVVEHLQRPFQTAQLVQRGALVQHGRGVPGVDPQHIVVSGQLPLPVAQLILDQSDGEPGARVSRAQLGGLVRCRQGLGRPSHLQEIAGLLQPDGVVVGLDLQGLVQHPHGAGAVSLPPPLLRLLQKLLELAHGRQAGFSAVLQHLEVLLDRELLVQSVLLQQG